jgi:predicted dehydrogenase
MAAMIEGGAIDAVGVADPDGAALRAALDLAPGAVAGETLEDLLRLDLDGIVIATPSALHAGQSIAALRHGLAVFCQKPLGRSEAETLAVVEAARSADRLLEVDLSYRFTRGMAAIRELIQAGELGRVFACDLVFHNAYGPDKPWFYDPALSGGGCVADLGVHLADLATWALDFPAVEGVSGRLFAGGEPLRGRRDRVEDYAVATLDLAGGAVVRLACSWRLQAGRDADISMTFHGTAGGARMRNVAGSFHDFVTERLRGRECESLLSPPEDWGGRAAAAWAGRLAAGERFDPAAGRLVETAAVLDGIYGR